MMFQEKKHQGKKKSSWKLKIVAGRKRAIDGLLGKLRKQKR